MKKLMFVAALVSFTATAAEPKSKAPKLVECTRVDVTGPDFVLGVTVHPKLPKYQLKVVVEEGRVAQLELGPEGDAKPQVIGESDELDAILTNDVYPVLQCDLNFDGYQDLLVFSMTGTPANEWFSFLVFDPTTKRFRFDGKTMVGNPQLDAARREVVGVVGSGCCSTTTTRIKVEKTRVRVISEKSRPLQ